MGELQVFSVGGNGEHTFLDLHFFSHPGLVFHRHSGNYFSTVIPLTCYE